MSRARRVLPFAFLLLTGCGAFPGQEAPERCGFPDGTALSYAGRSTTAALGVQEVVGDPMSDDPADIYITRDPFDQGELRGRLVCAIFVNQPDFVEVTVHPADGGRFVPEPEPSTPATPDGTPDETAAGISREDAVDAALDALEDTAKWEVAVAEAGPLGEVRPGWEDTEWGRGLPAALLVWRVFLVSGDLSAEVVIDFVDGSVYGWTQGIAN